MVDYDPMEVHGEVHEDFPKQGLPHDRVGVVYTVVDRTTGQVLIIGESGAGGVDRIDAHFQNKSKSSSLYYRLDGDSDPEVDITSDDWREKLEFHHRAVPSMNTAERRQLEEALIEEYDPPYNY